MAGNEKASFDGESNEAGSFRITLQLNNSTTTTKQCECAGSNQRKRCGFGNDGIVSKLGEHRACRLTRQVLQIKRDRVVRSVVEGDGTPAVIYKRNDCIADR